MTGVILDRHTGRPVVDPGLRRSLEQRAGGERIIRSLERGRVPIVGAERNPPLYMDVSNAYSGDELGLPWRDVISEGVVGATDLAVTGHAAANSIDVAKGTSWVTGDTNPDLQPTYRCFNDAVVNLGINPDPAQPRRVRVVAQVTDQGFAGSGRTWALSALHGTPAASPVLPAEPASAVSLADVLVPLAAASSAAYTITDLRPRATIGGTLGLRTPHVAVTRAATQAFANTATSTVIYTTVETLADPRNIYSLNAGTGVVTVAEAGVYLVSSTIFWAPGGTGDRLTMLLADGAEYARGYMPGGYSNSTCSYAVWVRAGGLLRTDGFQSSGASVNANSARMTITQLTRT
jgi:hypothetical protein